MNSNGLVSFNNEMPTFYNVPFPLDYPALAAFYANVDLRGSGQVYYREARDARTVGLATALVGRFYPRLDGRFAATAVFVATWHQVGYYKKNADKANTFQVGATAIVNLRGATGVRCAKFRGYDRRDVVPSGAKCVSVPGGFSSVGQSRIR